MRNVVNEKPTYAELEKKVKDSDTVLCIAFAVITVLMVACMVFSSKMFKWEKDAEFHKEMSQTYKRASKHSSVIEYEQKIRLNRRENELREAEFNLEVRRIQEEASFELNRANLALEREQLKNGTIKEKVYICQ